MQDLEGMLAELMRRSEEIMGRVEQQRHQERAPLACDLHDGSGENTGYS